MLQRTDQVDPMVLEWILFQVCGFVDDSVEFQTEFEQLSLGNVGSCYLLGRSVHR